MTDIRIENGRKMEKLLKVVGPTGAAIKKENEWDLLVYITDQDEENIWIEMCEMDHIGRDPVMDPFMKIQLKRNSDGHITQAIPVAYQSDNLFSGRTDINENGEIFLNLQLIETKKGELDRRLESWLQSIDLIGYLEEPHEILFRES